MTYIFLIYLGITLSVALAVIVPLQLFLYGFSLVTKRSDIASVGWPIGIAGVMIAYLFLMNHTLFQFKILLVLIMLWGLRMAYHNGSRFFYDKDESTMYALLRKKWTWYKTRSFFQIFMLEGLLMVMVMMPVISYVAAPGLTHLWKIYLGLALWVGGFILQLVADWQLEQYRKKPARYKLKKSDLMTKGLWSISRHPNYLGEIMMWWGIWLICLYTTYYAYFIATIIGPITITIIVLFMLGIRPTEKRWSEVRPEQFMEYKKNTPILIPGISDSKWQDVLSKIKGYWGKT